MTSDPGTKFASRMVQYKPIVDVWTILPHHNIAHSYMCLGATKGTFRRDFH